MFVELGLLIIPFFYWMCFCWCYRNWHLIGLIKKKNVKKEKKGMKNLKWTAVVAVNVSKPGCKLSCCWKNKLHPTQTLSGGMRTRNVKAEACGKDARAHCAFSTLQCWRDGCFSVPVWRLLIHDWLSISILLP